MKILHVVARSHSRGAELAATELSQELEALGHESHLVALGLSHDGHSDPALPPLVAKSSSSPFVLLLTAFRLRRLLRSFPAHVVMAHGGWAAQATAVAVPRGGPLLVWQRILGFPPSVWKPFHQLWWRVIVRRVDAAVALTSDLETELRRLRFDGPVWLIPNSRRPGRFADLDRAEEGSALRQSLGLEDDAPLIGFVGHLMPQKRPERAIEVLSGVRAKGIPAHLIVAGDGPRRRAMEDLARTLGLQEHVSLLGHRTDVERVFAAVDLCLLTSDAEGIPGVAIEAQMAGTPTISFPLGGIGEVIENGVTGVVLPRSDVTLMTNSVVELLEDSVRRRAMGEEARRRTPFFAASRTALRYAEELVELERARSAARWPEVAPPT